MGLIAAKPIIAGSPARWASLRAQAILLSCGDGGRDRGLRRLFRVAQENRFLVTVKPADQIRPTIAGGDGGGHHHRGRRTARRCNFASHKAKSPGTASAGELFSGPAPPLAGAAVTRSAITRSAVWGRSGSFRAGRCDPGFCRSHISACRAAPSRACRTCFGRSQKSPQ